MAKKEVYRSVKLTDNINATQLTVTDQVRLLLAKVSNNDEAELDARTKLNAEHMKKIAALNRLFDTAIEKMQNCGKSQVTLDVSSEFLPYIDEVVDEKHGKGRYYDITVYKKDLPSTIKHLFLVVIRKR